MAVDVNLAATLGGVIKGTSDSPIISGDVRFEETFWDDLKFPATAINPPGQASDPDREATSGLLLFAAGGTELVYALAQMPHKWAEGNTLHPHVHWQKTTSASGDVGWRLRYKHFSIGETSDGSWTDNGIKTTVATGTPDNDTADEHLITSLGDISMAGKGLSDCILFEVSRIGGDASDTYGADARLIEFDVHFDIDRLGSNNEYSN